MWDLVRDRIRAPLVHLADAIENEHPGLSTVTEVHLKSEMHPLFVVLAILDRSSEEEVGGLDFGYGVAPQGSADGREWRESGPGADLQLFPCPHPEGATIQSSGDASFMGELFDRGLDVQSRQVLPRGLIFLDQAEHLVLKAVFEQADSFIDLMRRFPEMLDERLSAKGLASSDG
jgi:hypothetical protein